MSKARIALLPVLLIAGALFVAQPAAATDYCVHPRMDCPVYNFGDIQTALSAAAGSPEADRIFLGTAIYAAPSPGFNYQAAGPVEVIGEGTGSTIIQNNAGNPAHNLLRVVGGTGTSVHDLAFFNGSAPLGASSLVTNGVAHHIEVHDSVAELRYGVVLTGGGVLEHSKVTLSNGGSAVAVQFDTGGGTLRDSSVSARTAVESRADAKIERSRLTGSYVGVQTLSGATTVESSVVRATGPFGIGIGVGAQNGADGEAHVNGSVIAGPGSASTSGVAAYNFPDATRNANVTVANTAILGFEKPLDVQAFGSGSAHVTSAFSNYDAAANHTSGAKATIDESNISNAGDSAFVDAAGGDYHPAPGSPLVDAGDPAAAQGLDFDGNPLVVDGDLDGSARRDIGAFELSQPPTPAPPGTPPAAGGPTPTGPGAGAADKQAPLVTGFRYRRARFRYTLSETARVTLRVQRVGGRVVGKLVRNGRKGANLVKFSGRLGKRTLRPGRYRAVITATDAAGNRSAAKRTSFRIL